MACIEDVCHGAGVVDMLWSVGGLGEEFKVAYIAGLTFLLPYVGLDDG